MAFSISFLFSTMSDLVNVSLVMRDELYGVGDHSTEDDLHRGGDDKDDEGEGFHEEGRPTCLPPGLSLCS